MTVDPHEAVMATMPPGSVVITPTQMYAEIRVMSGKIDHLANVIDPALAGLRDDIGAVDNKVKDHEARLRSIEKRLWLMAGAATAAGAGIAQVIAQVRT